ncbi:hypothetical protein [Halocola ammonii]
MIGSFCSCDAAKIEVQGERENDLLTSLVTADSLLSGNRSQWEEIKF